MKKVYLLKNRYVDSVTLMTIAVELAEKEGIRGAECGMGTKQNIRLLLGLGYEVPQDATPNDVMIALEAEEEFNIHRNALQQKRHLLRIALPGATTGILLPSGSRKSNSGFLRECKLF